MDYPENFEQTEALDALFTDVLLEELAEAMPTAYTWWRIQRQMQHLASKACSRRRWHFKMDAIPRVRYILSFQPAWGL